MEPIMGMIVQFAGNFAPRGWMLCQGQLLSIAQNTALFSILGTTYGGNGQTTFALPDLRGRVCIQPGQGPGLSYYNLGESSGAETVTLLVSNMPAHNHSFLAANTSDNQSSPAGNALGQSPLGNIYTTDTPNTPMNAQVVGATGNNAPFSIMQPFLAINWIIATEGVYPSRD